MQKHIVIEVQAAKSRKKRAVPIEVKFKWKDGIAKRLEQKFGFKVIKAY